MEIKNTFSHSGNCGDVLASLPSLKEFYKKTGKRAILYLKSDQKAFYYEGAIHPVKDETGAEVMLNQYMIKMVLPLLNAQNYIEFAKEWQGEEVAIDLDAIRTNYVGMPNSPIQLWYPFIYPDLYCDLSEAWLEVPDTEKDFAKGKFIVTRTERYLNNKIDYSFLKDYENDILFAGTELEFIIFKTRFGLNIKRLEVNDFLELAQAVKQSKFHLSNQTMAYQISEGIKKPRIVEICSYAPNVIPFGKDGYSFYAQGAVQYFVQTLYNKY